MNRSKLLIATLLGSSIAIFFGPKTVIAAETAPTFTVCDAAQKLPSVPIKGLNDWLFIDSEFASNRFAWDFEWGKQYEPLRRFSEALERQGMKLLVIPVPNRPAIYSEGIDRNQVLQGKYSVETARANYNDSVEKFRKIGINTVNIQEAFLQHSTSQGSGSQQTGVAEKMFFARDHHWTPAGARVAAQAVKAQIGTDILQRLPKAEYATRMTGMYDFHGNIPDKVETACPGVRIPNEQISNYLTERQDAGNLLGDEAIDVALIGSSYSAAPWSPKELDYNFAGFLQENLQTGIVNAAISGGGYDAASEAYFLSPAYAQHKPKVVLFEFWYFPYKQELNAFRRIIPSIYGACDADRTVIADSTVPLETGVPSVMASVNAKSGIKGAANYLYFQVSDPSLTNFKVSLEYDNGQTEVVPVNRNARIKNDGRFFLDLNDAFKGNLVKASLLPDAKTTGSVTARMCRAPSAIR
jgi:alginate biosynthesis protein AlgX